MEQSHKSIIAHEPEGKYASIAPFRVLSFDIECSSHAGSFPKAPHDSVIQIGNVLSIQGVFVLRTVIPTSNYSRRFRYPGKDFVFAQGVRSDCWNGCEIVFIREAALGGLEETNR